MVSLVREIYVPFTSDSLNNCIIYVNLLSFISGSILDLPMRWKFILIVAHQQRNALGHILHLITYMYIHLIKYSHNLQNSHLHVHDVVSYMYLVQSSISGDQPFY